MVTACEHFSVCIGHDSFQSQTVRWGYGRFRQTCFLLIIYKPQFTSFEDDMKDCEKQSAITPLANPQLQQPNVNQQQLALNNIIYNSDYGQQSVTQSSLFPLKSDRGRCMCQLHIYNLSASAASFCNSPTEHEVEHVGNLILSILPGTYEGWNFNSGNYLFATDTKQIHVSKFYCPSVQSPALCTTRYQRCGSHRIPLAAPVVLIVRIERSTA